MRVREGDVAGADEQALLDEYFAFRSSAFPPDRTYVVAKPRPADFAPGHGVFLVAEDDLGRPIGCAGLRAMPVDPCGSVRGEVKHVWVRPEARGIGAGGALMDEVERRAQGWGMGELVLDTHHTLESAARLYARHGFVPIAPYNANPNATRWYGKRID